MKEQLNEIDKLENEKEKVRNENKNKLYMNIPNDKKEAV
jgi:hypothetical protein